MELPPGTTPAAQVCWEWARGYAAQQPPVTAEAATINGLIAGLVLGVALSHVDREWALAAAQELTTLVERIGQAEGYNPASDTRFRTLYLSEARKLIARAQALQGGQAEHE